MFKRLLIFPAALLPVVAILLFNQPESTPISNAIPTEIPAQTTAPITQTQVQPIPTTEPLPELPSRKILQNDYHIFQTFNNCGPAAFSMALSYYGINQSQKVLGEALRPYQNPQGDNDDKSTTLAELAEKSKEYNLVPFHRPNGNIEYIKYFIANDMPVITRTWLKENDDIGHYRVVKGFDDTTHQLIQDDSLQGKNLRYDYDKFNAIWKKLNYEYLVLVPPEKLTLAQTILGDEADPAKSWQKAADNAQEHVANDPSDVYARFNLSIALYHTGNYQQSIEEFEKVEKQLSMRTLWYQIEPILAYAELNDYPRVFQITDKILQNHNRAFSELYIIRGDIYKEQGNLILAKQEYEKAVLYNRNLKAAQDALDSLN